MEVNKIKIFFISLVCLFGCLYVFMFLISVGVAGQNKQFLGNPWVNRGEYSQAIKSRIFLIDGKYFPNPHKKQKIVAKKQGITIQFNSIQFAANILDSFDLEKPK